MTTGVEQVTIIGVGLLGASFGLALKKRTQVLRIVGVGRSEASLEVALERGAIDEAVLEVETGVSRADVVCIATPAARWFRLLDAAVVAAPSHTIFFDMASTKQAICDHASATYPVPRRFVGCHPMAGGEKYGAAHAPPIYLQGRSAWLSEDAAIDVQVRGSGCVPCGRQWKHGWCPWTLRPTMPCSPTPATPPHSCRRSTCADRGGCRRHAGFRGQWFSRCHPDCRVPSRIMAGYLHGESHRIMLFSKGNKTGTSPRWKSLLENKDAAGLQAFFESAVAARRRILEL
jgi:hypothetical protein